MSIKNEYIVTVKDRADLSDIYHELETEGISPASADITRPVECVKRRDISRNTHYLMTDEEAEQLRADPRILAVELLPSALGMKPTPTVLQYATTWDRGSTAWPLGTPPTYNWGVLRSQQEVGVKNWGDYNDANTFTISGVVDLPYTGKNVDVVIVDGDGILGNHPEFAVNADGTGGSRFIPYNWFQHNPAVTGGEVGTYTYVANGDSHATHVAGNAAGNRQGFARDANIYNIAFDKLSPPNFELLVFDYVREFHANKPVNPATGRPNPTIMNNSWGFTYNQILPQLSMSKIDYQGEEYPPMSGLSGLFDEKERIIRFEAKELSNVTHQITTTANTAVAEIIPPQELTPLTYEVDGVSPLIPSPATFASGLGYRWEIDLPHPINYRGIAYNIVSVYSEGALVFGRVTDVPMFTESGYMFRPFTIYAPKIMMCATPNYNATVASQDVNSARVMTTYDSNTNMFTIVVHSSDNNATFNSKYEFQLFLDTTNTPSSPGIINLTVRENSKAGFFDWIAKADFGLVFKDGGWKTVPAKYPALDADLEDAIADGIISIGAASNESYLIAEPGDINWDNKIWTNSTTSYTLCQGASPTASTETLNNITVGALGVPVSYLQSAYAFAKPAPDEVSDIKASFSNCGPGVDIWAAGLNVTSAYTNTNIAAASWSDPRDLNYKLAKFNGTSMAAPHVAGIVACMLEQDPTLTQARVKEILTNTSINGEVLNNSYGSGWWYTIQGAPNKIARYNSVPKTEGQNFPNNARGSRATEGKIYPRVKQVFAK